MIQNKVIPALGDMLVPIRGYGGIVVHVLPSGGQIILACPSPFKRGAILETIHDTKDCRGLMTGRQVVTS